MDRQITLKKLSIIAFLTFFLCLGMAVMTDQVFAQGSVATVNANGTIKEVNCHDDWVEALKLINRLGQDTWVEISLHSDITERVPELDSYRIKMTINLNGYTWTINDSTSMQTYRDIIINGGGGTITIAEGVYPSGLFCCYYSDATTKVYINNTNFTDCNCGRYPLFYLIGNDNAARIYLENCNFTRCTSTSFGGVLYGKRINIINYSGCTFDTCKSTYGGVFYIEDSKFDDYPSGCLCHDTNTTGPKTIVKNCAAAYYGGLAYLDNSGFNLADNIDIQSCSAQYGGAIYCDSNSSFGLSAYNSELTVSNCTAKCYGGFCYSEGNFLINGPGNGKFITIHDCSAQKGGVLYMGNDNRASIECTHIYDCSATDGGSIVYCDSYDETDLVFSRVEFIDSKQSSKDGELIYCVNSIIDVYLDSKIITNNPRTVYNGGSFGADGFEIVPFDGNPVGTLLSNGSLLIIVAIAVVALVIIAIVINKKKNRPVA